MLLKNGVFMSKIYLVIFLFITVTLNFTGEEKVRSAVLNFTAKGWTDEASNKKLDAIASSITENTTTCLIKTSKFDIVERTQMDKITNELKLQNMDDFDEKTRTAIGTQLGVQLVFIGSITLIGNNYTINIRGVEVSTGKVLYANSKSTLDINEINNKTEELINEMILDQKSKDEPKTVIDNTKKPSKIKKWLNNLLNK